MREGLFGFVFHIQFTEEQFCFTRADSLGFELLHLLFEDRSPTLEG